MAAWRALLEELVRERRPALIGYATLLTGDRSQAEDLVYDAIVRTFSRPRSFPSLNAADAYVRRAIASAFIDRMRSRRSWLGAMGRRTPDDDTPDDDPPDASTPDDDAAVGRDVRSALGGLPPRQRTCVVMQFCDDMRIADIADALGLSDGAVKRYLSEGVHHLNVALGAAADPAMPDAPTADVLAIGKGVRR